MAVTKKESIRQAIAREKALLADLARKETQSQARLAALNEELSAARSDGQVASIPVPRTITDTLVTAQEKISLFLRLFRGRDDVFPKLWTSSKTGRKGYSPACGNEWVRGVCGKPRVKCSDCPNQAFMPLTDQVILDHLQGRHIVGVYPLLKDDTCWFLAADFDKDCWLEDVAAFVDTCRDLGIPAAVERSRSGNGAHVWFFFSSPVSAISARRMGCYLITETMARRHQLAMSSYDRLFPNQDTVPRGGFGNLIALPLQHEPRQAGNSVFLDEAFRPHEDQWTYLASVPRMVPATVESIAQQAARQGKIVGVRFSAVSEDGRDDNPWDRPRTSEAEKTRIVEPVPGEVCAVLAQRLFVEKAGLPSPLLN